jgi:antitoxin ParD1/3/4
MNISLTPELRSLIDAKVKAGEYQDASDVVREGLRLLKERDAQQAQLRQDVLAGFAEVAMGRFVEYDERTTPNLLRDIKARGRRRLARIKKTQAG